MVSGLESLRCRAGSPAQRPPSSPQNTLNSAPGSPREWPFSPRAGAVPGLVPAITPHQLPPGSHRHQWGPVTHRRHQQCFGAACLAQVQRRKPPPRPSAKHPPARAQPETLPASSGGEEEPVAVPAGSVLPVLNTALGAVSPATGDKSVIGVRANRFRAGPDSASAPSSAKLRRGEGSGWAFWRRAGGGC